MVFRSGQDQKSTNLTGWFNCHSDFAPLFHDPGPAVRRAIEALRSADAPLEQMRSELFDATQAYDLKPEDTPLQILLESTRDVDVARQVIDHLDNNETQDLSGFRMWKSVLVSRRLLIRRTVTGADLGNVVFGGPQTNVVSADFGRIRLLQVNIPRQIQFGLRFTY